MKKNILITMLVMALFAWGLNVQAQKDPQKGQNEKEVKIEKRVVVQDDVYDDVEDVEEYEDEMEFDNPRPFHGNIPGLTDEQKAQLDKLKVDHQKKTRLMHANLQERRAHLNILRLADNPDMQQINKTIDEIAKVQADLMKEREAHRMAVRSQLNDEQKAWFDSRPRGGRGFGPAHRGGMGRGHRMCW